MRVKNSKKFYDWLHSLEDADEEWYVHVGEELWTNKYSDDGDPLLTADQIIQERRTLALLRDEIDVKAEARNGWRSAKQRDGIRLLVTVYRQYGLRYDEISKLLHMSSSTLRHDYRALEPGEIIDVDYRTVLHAHRPQAHQFNR